MTLSFESYEEACEHPDVKYALEVNSALSSLVSRVESLNVAGNLLWSDRMPDSFEEFPVSRYNWLTLAADVFLMRYTSVVDCAMILANSVFETDLDLRNCTLERLARAGLSQKAYLVLSKMLDDQGALRHERNARFHHGRERGFSQDSRTFRMASQFEHWGSGIAGNDIHGRPIDVRRSFLEGLVELQRDFNSSTKSLVRRLDRFYDILEDEFEARFGPRIRAATHGLNVVSRNKTGKDDDA